jgi:Tol biopolymer transport system component
MKLRFVFVCLLTLPAASGTDGEDPEYRYRNPIVFQRAHLDEQTGKQILAGKLWLMEEDGSHLKQLTSGPGYDEHSSFYSDQRHVLYSEFPVNAYDHSTEARLVKLDIYTAEKEVVAHLPGCALHHASVSPAGDILVYHRQCGKRLALWAGLPESGYEVTMAATNGVAMPDGVIFMHEKNRGYQPREVGIVRMWGHGAGAKAQFLTDAKHLHRRPAVSPDLKWMAWQTNAAGDGDEIFLAKIDGSEARNLTKAKGDDGHPWFSRDGKWIVFESDRSGQWEIWRMDLDTGKQTQLTNGGSRYISTRPRL